MRNQSLNRQFERVFVISFLLISQDLRFIARKHLSSSVNTFIYVSVVEHFCTFFFFFFGHGQNPTEPKKKKKSVFQHFTE